MFALFLGAAGFAGPWLNPGDAGLRHDLEVLADRGVLRGPITSWPLSWADIARDVLDVDLLEGLDPTTQACLLRVQREARRMTSAGDTRSTVRAAASGHPRMLRTFSDTPREEAEVQAAVEWTGRRFATNLQAGVVGDPDDGQHLRPDGSYVGAHLGNFMLSAGFMERWWGPGWEGSLILSNNARPIPALSVERNYSDAFKSPWLSWIGPWRANILLGQLEGHRADFAHTRFLAMRISFKPLRQLEIALSRSAQWCGAGRPCGLQTLGDLLAGRDNDQPASEQPGNQMAGYDVRWGFGSIPLALYAQYIGEDEANGLPSKFLGLGGAEVWGSSPWGQWRWHAEYADTSCSFSRQAAIFNCAYENSIYRGGYRYRGRAIGHALDNDGRMLSMGALLIDGAGRRWELLLRDVDLNRDATVPQLSHTVAPLAAKLTNIELSHGRELTAGRLQVGIGFDDYGRAPRGSSASQVRGFVQWSREF